MKFNTEGMTEVTDYNLVDLVKNVYALSYPVGLGYLNFQEGELSDEDAENIINKEKNYNNVIVSMDYVHGRCCKFTVWEDDDGRRWTRSTWFDHTDELFEKLLNETERR